MAKISIDTIATSRRIKEMMDEQKISPMEVQTALGLGSVQAVYKWTSSMNKSIPSTENLVQLSELLGCEIEDLLLFQNGYRKKRTSSAFICPSCGANVEQPNYLCSSRDIITLGEYWQGMDKDYGKTPLEWRVLAREKDGKILIISRDVIDCLPYDENGKGWHQTWENCSIRKWLNEVFLKETFNQAEQELIVETHNENQDNAKFGTDGGNDTLDKIFLLSSEEVKQYFILEEYYRDDIASPSKYARSRGTRVNHSLNCNWWLRSVGNCMYGMHPRAVLVGVDGRIHPGGEDMEFDFIGVRPALWIDGTKL